ncbi:tRNA (N6-isopentenyl adenosine(37)-C2)-methylthiotransferase MiaB [Kolteria novifilia]|uniref:tRNA (N6-isopentenyl adenosine(37)-C2)-methylthiotransferase MiaB n=1 Tax=Kolteria novifilia TaxID=2527975 RepID=UPI003AF3F3A8
MVAPVDSNQTATRKLYLETVGCQMNVLDSELVVGGLRQAGYELTHNAKEADTILFNTCSVRQHAEDKIYSALGRLKRAKNQRPDLVIGVLGCMAQKDQQKIFSRAPHVDLICSPGQLARVPEMIDEARTSRRQLAALGLGRKEGPTLQILGSFESYDPLREPGLRPTPFQAYVRLMMGCDKFCTYCIVPMVRGPEQGRPPESIVEEVRRLVGEGCREITYLGQTVNSYKYQHEDGRTYRLSDLLAMVHDFEGLDRIKFITNYPKDMTDDLLEAVRDLPKVSSYLHVPSQSGCDEVLKAMKRGYTDGEYREMLHRIHETIPDAAVSSDFIVGFPGETDASFEKTCDLVRDARFKNSFIFKYSPREGTKAFPLPDDVPEDVKKERNNELLAIQSAISAEDNERFVGQIVDILVEGPSKTSLKVDDESPVRQMSGRTHNDYIVVYEGNQRQAGQILPVRIVDATPHTLFGEVVTHELVSIG